METFVKNLKNQLEIELNNVSQESNPVISYGQRIKLVKNIIKQLQQYVRENHFPDKRTEIGYFKYIAPYFYSRLYLFRFRFNLEIYKITEDDDFPLYLQHKMSMVKGFLSKYGPLHRYYHSFEVLRDEELFVRKNSEKDQRSLYCKSSRRLSQIQACEQFRAILKRELNKRTLAQEIPEDYVECKYTKSGVVEFITTVFESKGFYVNGQPATQEYVKKRTEQYFNMVVENFSELDNANRSRKGDMTPFFTKLKEQAVARAERLDDQNRLKKRRL